MSAGSKIAVVTGAGTGIGRAAALSLVAEGWSVALAGRRAEMLEETRHAAGADQDRMIAVPTDVANPVSVQALFERVAGDYGRLDLLFNNAGTSAPAVPFDELTAEQWRGVVDVNLNGMFFCAQQAFRMMKSQSPQGGRIINNGSISATAPRPNSAPYTATKHAVTGLTKSLALDGRPWNIACGQIDIGNAETPMTAKVKNGTRQANGEMLAEPYLDVAHVGRSVAQMASLPLDANVLFITLMATKMPFVGRG